MDITDFSYELPEELIAQEPAKERHLSRLMVIDRSGSLTHGSFADITDYLGKGDCIVLNDTRVIPARLIGKRIDTGGKIEFLLIKKMENDLWEVILKPGKRGRPGTRFVFGRNGELEAEIIRIVDQGNRIVRFSHEGDFRNVLQNVGQIPLPPYIREEPPEIERYQTVYSRTEGSAAAPTAGLHFTDGLLAKIRNKGVSIVKVTLHVNIGTFRPVKKTDITEHIMHEEYYSMTKDAASTINLTKRGGGKVFAVGTTSCRVLETLAGKDGYVRDGSGWTDIFIYPGYEFKVVDVLITNFHLPCSTLLMLVCAFAGKDAVMSAYREAIEKKYRFYSFGDAMLLL